MIIGERSLFVLRSVKQNINALCGQNVVDLIVKTAGAKINPSNL
jgi:hypothetical protein